MRAAVSALMLMLLVSACWPARDTPAQPDSNPGAGSLLDVRPAPFASPTPAPAACTQDPVAQFPAEWIWGENCATEPTLQIHSFDADTWIIRQSLCTNFEGPFLYLLFGEDKVLLEDTGAGGIDISTPVYNLIDGWLTDNGKTSIELVVVNSHAHGDHTQGNSQFIGQAGTSVVGTSVTAISQFFGITNWPTETVSYDLGNRIIDVIPIPGHQTSHIALFDRTRGLLLTGDTLYAGRLYINDFGDYRDSLERLVQHTENVETCWVLGTHVEMTNTPGIDFPFGSDLHPDEHPLQLERTHLLELRDAVVGMGNPTYEAHDEFIIYPL